MYEYKAHVMRVVDGDTFDAQVELGFNVSLKLRFRLQGIDTPEITHAKTQDEKDKGYAAKGRLSQLIEGKEVVLKSFKPNGVQGPIFEAVYNRWEAAVFVGSVNVAQQLKDEGYSKVVL